ncbi:MAG: protease inhibitor I42 family protein, partial [Pseudomonadota bacterium]
PKEIKSSFLGDYAPPDWRSDVWVLTERDEGALIEGGKNDLFVVRLRENSGAGYLWNIDQLREAGFAVVADDREDIDFETVGSTLTRRVTARSEDRVQGSLVLQERRPWLPANPPLHELRLDYDLRGPEQPGMWEPELRRALELM